MISAILDSLRNENSEHSCLFSSFFWHDGQSGLIAAINTVLMPGNTFHRENYALILPGITLILSREYIGGIIITGRR